MGHRTFLLKLLRPVEHPCLFCESGVAASEQRPPSLASLGDSDSRGSETTSEVGPRVRLRASHLQCAGSDIADLETRMRGSGGATIVISRKLVLRLS